MKTSHLTPSCMAISLHAPVRYFFRYEVQHLLARCGYRVSELFGSFDRRPLRDDSSEMVFAAEKRDLSQGGM